GKILERCGAPGPVFTRLHRLESDLGVARVTYEGAALSVRRPLLGYGPKGCFGHTNLDYCNAAMDSSVISGAPAGCRGNPQPRSEPPEAWRVDRITRTQRV